ncbi:hypothetical protein E6O75_ATG02700 [Venturia nashicola]|uniref:DUF3830 family protein n=1 Tax=Venturia nashicola TaxID=86259 RepID=A0A4Z1P7T9_9PEZI|nr:hypothetical protein E6O75_ATG02700 [Venturia nashicola]
MSSPPQNLIKITTPTHTFLARLETEAAPQTSALFLSHLPYTQKLIHVRWSGEALWIPLGYSNTINKVQNPNQTSLPQENHTAHPAPGQILLYPGGISETEFLWAYGACHFASKMGVLAGNHFLTVVEGGEGMRGLGEKVLWDGAVSVRFEVADEGMVELFREEREREVKREVKRKAKAKI